MQKRIKPAFKSFLPGIAWFFVVLLLLCLPGNQLPRSKLFAIIFFDKMIHVGCFALLVFLFYWPMRQQDGRHQYLARLCMATIIWGITSELIQKYFIPYRSFDWFDWLADSTGVLLAGAVLKRWPK